MHVAEYLLVEDHKLKYYNHHRHNIQYCYYFINHYYYYLQHIMKQHPTITYKTLPILKPFQVYLPTHYLRHYDKFKAIKKISQRSDNGTIVDNLG